MLHLLASFTANNAGELPLIAWLIAGFSMGIVGAAHCAGMCGAFPLAIASRQAGGKVKGVLLYNAGRVFTYLMLGTIAAAIGHGLGRGFAWEEGLSFAARILSVVAGVVIFCSGLFLLGVRLPFFKEGHRGFIADTVINGTRSLMKSKSPFAPIGLGVVNGLLPCPLVYAMLIAALNLGVWGVLDGGVALAAGFGAGTLPIMVTIGLLGAPLIQRWRAPLAKAGGVFLMLFAVLTVIRGVEPDALHSLMPGMAHAEHGGNHIAIHSIQLDLEGNIIQRPEGMSEETYAELLKEEMDWDLRVGEAIESGNKSELRRVEAELAAYDREQGRTHGLTYRALTEIEVQKLQTAGSEEDLLTYRCACCGTPRKTSRRFLKPGTVLLLDGDGPWSSSQERSGESETLPNE